MKSFFETSGKLFSKASKVKYFLNQSKNINHEIENLNLDYVYFPLSYQPEATTLSYGDEYDDQLLAIEKIDKIIPKNWKILVKEHPYQIDQFYRGNLFYERIKLIKSVIMIPAKKFENEDLIKKSKFVSTVSGNTGWESIRMLKQVLLFGRPWYLSLPGVVNINEFKNLDDFLALSWDLKDIKYKIEDLSQKMGDGLINLDYLNSKDIFNDFKVIAYNNEDNVDKIINSIKKIISSIS